MHSSAPATIKDRYRKPRYKRRRQYLKSHPFLYVCSLFLIVHMLFHSEDTQKLVSETSTSKNSKGPMDILKEYQIVFVLLGAVIVCGAIVGILNATGKEGPNHL